MSLRIGSVDILNLLYKPLVRFSPAELIIITECLILKTPWHIAIPCILLASWITYARD